MQANNTIAFPAPVGSPMARLRAGDSVLVWDGVKGQNIWQEIADIKEVEGRWKIRVAQTDFYFDESLVVSSASTREREETDNAARIPVAVRVTQNGFGSIGVCVPLRHCENCGEHSRRLFNIGTEVHTYFVCYDCRFPEYGFSERRMTA